MIDQILNLLKIELNVFKTFNWLCLFMQCID